jgi:hypothetical protein
MGEEPAAAFHCRLDGRDPNNLGKCTEVVLVAAPGGEYLHREHMLGRGAITRMPGWSNTSRFGAFGRIRHRARLARIRLDLHPDDVTTEPADCAADTVLSEAARELAQLLPANSAQRWALPPGWSLTRPRRAACRDRHRARSAGRDAMERGSDEHVVTLRIQPGLDGDHYYLPAEPCWDDGRPSRPNSPTNHLTFVGVASSY